MNNLLALFGNAALRTITDLILVLGIYAIFGFVLYLLERMTQATYIKSVGWKGILWTAWLGTPIHETAHLIFCILFRHKIVDVQFFSPDKTTGNLGYVNHSWNPRSIYQSIGNLPIGAAPLFVGAVAIYLLLKYLVPGSELLVTSNQVALDPNLLLGSPLMFLGQLKDVAVHGFSTLQALLTTYPSSVRFWIFVYLAFCISSHIAPSPADIKGIGQGLIIIVITLLILYFVTGYFGWTLPAWVHFANRYTSIGFTLFTLAIFISALHFCIAYIVLTTINILRGRGLIFPF